MKGRDLVGREYKGFYIHDYKRENKRTYLLTECPFCHNNKWMRKDTLDVPSVVSCGCYNSEKNWVRPKDLTGKKFGFLIAKEPTEQRAANGSIVWKCECTKCGKDCLVSVELLTKGVASCGCLQKEAVVKNGQKVGRYVKEEHCVDGTNVKNLTQKLSKNNTSGVKGVYWDKSKNKWVAQIRFKGKNYYLGRYFKKEDAADARKIAEEKLFGDFLRWYSEIFSKKGGQNEFKKN